MRHFVRGLFDGDGCIHKLKAQENGCCITIAGTENLLEGIQGYLSSRFGLKSYLHPRGKIYCLTIHKREDSLKLYKVFYSVDATVYLQRKKDIFDLIEPIRPRVRNKTGNKFIKRLAGT